MPSIRLGLTAMALASMMGAAVAQTTSPTTPTTPATPAATPPAETTAPQQKPLLPGANSFTESQARDVMEKAGFQDVKELKKDEQGIWRGQASKSGQQVGVALDYRGNVVQQ